MANPVEMSVCEEQGVSIAPGLSHVKPPYDGKAPLARLWLAARQDCKVTASRRLWTFCIGCVLLMVSRGENK